MLGNLKGWERREPERHPIRRQNRETQNNPPPGRAILADTNAARGKPMRIKLWQAVLAGLLTIAVIAGITIAVVSMTITADSSSLTKPVETVYQTATPSPQQQEQQADSVPQPTAQTVTPATTKRVVRYVATAEIPRIQFWYTGSDGTTHRQVVTGKPRDGEYEAELRITIPDTIRAVDMKASGYGKLRLDTSSGCAIFIAGTDTGSFNFGAETVECHLDLPPR